MQFWRIEFFSNLSKHTKWSEGWYHIFLAIAITYLLWAWSLVALDRIVSSSLLHYLIYVKLRRAGFNQLYLGCQNYTRCAGEMQLPWAIWLTSTWNFKDTFLSSLLFLLCVMFSAFFISMPPDTFSTFRKTCYLLIFSWTDSQISAFFPQLWWLVLNFFMKSRCCTIKHRWFSLPWCPVE